MAELTLHVCMLWEGRVNWFYHYSSILSSICSTTEVTFTGIDKMRTWTVRIHFIWFDSTHFIQTGSLYISVDQWTLGQERRDSQEEPLQTVRLVHWRFRIHNREYRMEISVYSRNSIICRQQPSRQPARLLIQLHGLQAQMSNYSLYTTALQ